MMGTSIKFTKPTGTSPQRTSKLEAGVTIFFLQRLTDFLCYN